MSTVKDLRRWHESFKHCKVGYVCYQEDGLTSSELVKLGSNAGIYGWNWTAYYLPATDTMYVSYYRNVPSDIIEK